ncbi:hypothetical protein B0H10DRAFT_2217633 [Mycena sp. CBHHK59/15]|nr:hypothetical protein B0H10DRAFT_2217633 [Mycena sp. CBHHK59/15]
MEYALPPPRQRNAKKSRLGRRRNVSTPSLHIHHAKPFHEQRGCAHSSVTLRPLPCGDSPCHTHDISAFQYPHETPSPRRQTTSDVHDDVHAELSAASLSRTPRTHSTTHALHISDVRHGPSPAPLTSMTTSSCSTSRSPASRGSIPHLRALRVHDITRAKGVGELPLLHTPSSLCGSSGPHTQRRASAPPRPRPAHPTYLLPPVTHEDTPWTSPRLPSKRAVDSRCLPAPKYTYTPGLARSSAPPATTGAP